MTELFVRVGALSQIFLARSETVVSLGRRVIVRTERGLELAEVVSERPAAAHGQQRGVLSPPVKVIRATTQEDELLIRRLQRHKRSAVESCREKLVASGSVATLLDVDQLFDGGTLVMHFLGPVDEIAHSITSEVIGQYESIVRSKHVAKLLMDGCGPDCGTKEGGGCGSSCAGCAVAKACSESSR